MKMLRLNDVPLSQVRLTDEQIEDILFAHFGSNPKITRRGIQAVIKAIRDLSPWDGGIWTNIYQEDDKPEIETNLPEGLETKEIDI